MHEFDANLLRTGSDDLLIGHEAIAAVFDRSPATLKRWLRRDPTFPVKRLPGGEPATTRSWIAEWIRQP
jgi:hypothetical protein